MGKQTMVVANHERVGRALNVFRDGFGPKCEETWEGFYGAGWLESVNRRLYTPDNQPSINDTAFLLKGVKATWNEVFSHGFPPAVRSLIFELADIRNTWAHQKAFTADDASRACDSMERVLEAFGCPDARQEIKKLRRDLLRQMFNEEARSDRRRKAKKHTTGSPKAGLPPWRNLSTPHADVREGRFEQAEFAADLHQVFTGKADREYQDPQEFFTRTFLTEGLRYLLVNAVRRLSSSGGDPVFELQTNFGGGKTHSLIALYHLASGLPASKLSGVGEALAEEGLSLPKHIARAVLVGQMLSPSTPQIQRDGVALRTMWGHLAYQLGGVEGYELVRADDEAATNPGAAVTALFEEYGPAVVLIDEWVAYARQLPDEGDARQVCGGSFDTQFTFAQTLTEAAASVPNVMVLVAIPQSEIEAGGDRGETALQRLRNVVSRKAAHWQPASPDESFEIVRKRLFDPMSAEAQRIRDGVIGEFMEMYRKGRSVFPRAAAEVRFRRRMEQSYPLHPELFDRLFDDWSSIDKFQRTRGVLRLLAIAISELWQRNDRSLLIMPGDIPMDSGLLVSEMKKYLDDGWDPVIKSDVDGPISSSLLLDQEQKHFGRIHATRRAARTVYMGSAPGADSANKVDARSVALGCAQPGEPAAQFENALKRLSNRASHLYVNGRQYWYSLRQNVNQLARDRAASDFDDDAADAEIKSRLSKQAKDRHKRGNFAMIQVFADGPGDVPDSDEGVRLVVLSPRVTHFRKDPNSSALDLAKRVLDPPGGHRLNRNLLVFLAAEHNRLNELRKVTRLFLAWRSIVDSYEEINLTAQQLKQAKSQVHDSSAQVDSLISETFTQVLAPKGKAGESRIDWQMIEAKGDGTLAERVSNKLASDETLIGRYGGVRVRIDVDRRNLWSERGDVRIFALWEAYSRYPYMPRLATMQTLLEAVGEGPSKINWEKETFAYAEAHDGTKWVGVRSFEHVNAEPSGLIIKPDSLPASDDDSDDAPGTGGRVGDPDSWAGGVGTGGESGSGKGGESDGVGAGGGSPFAASVLFKTKFYALFDLDADRCRKEFGKISEDLLRHLGSDVKLSLEVRATKLDGFDESTSRVVSENARELGATGAEFE